MSYFYTYMFSSIKHLDGSFGSNDGNTATLSVGSVFWLSTNRLTLTPLPPTCMKTKHTTYYRHCIMQMEDHRISKLDKLA